MKKTQIISILKFAAGTVIVIAAGLIVFPMLTAFVLGIMRLVMWVVLVLLVAHGLRYLWNATCGKNHSAGKNKKPPTMVVAILLQVVSTVALAQNPGGDTSLIIPAGTIFEGRIDTKVGSSISHSGDRFHIVIASPVLANGTTVLIPAGARVLGEVVEAVPANHVYHEKGMVKPKGKLRIQLTALEMPDGAIFPMVATLACEYFGTSHRHTDNPNLGHGVGYVGSSAGFNQVTPQSQYAPNGRTLKPQLVTRDQMLKDPLYGIGQTSANGGYGNRPVYRELEQHGNNIEIENGSPLSIRIDAALKIPFEEITQSVHDGKGLPAALGLDRDNGKAKHGHKKPAPAPAPYRQEQPGSSFIPGGGSGSTGSGSTVQAGQGTMPGTAPVRGGMPGAGQSIMPGAALPVRGGVPMQGGSQSSSPGPISPDSDAGF